MAMELIFISLSFYRIRPVTNQSTFTFLSLTEGEGAGVGGWGGGDKTIKLVHELQLFKLFYSQVIKKEHSHTYLRYFKIVMPPKKTKKKKRKDINWEKYQFFFSPKKI